MITADGITPAFGFQCGPTFRTQIVTLKNGRERRNADWSQAKHKAVAQFNAMTQAQFLYLKDLCLSCRGMANAFLFRDWTDYQAVDAQFGVGDGTTKTFQLSKTSSLPGGTPYIRTIRAPDAGVVVKVGGVVTAASVSSADGSVVFTTAPASGAALTWTGNYHLVMRFDSDDLLATIVDRSQGQFILSGTVNLLESFEDAI